MINDVILNKELCIALQGRDVGKNKYSMFTQVVQIVWFDI